MKFAFFQTCIISFCVMTSVGAGEAPKIDRIGPPGGQQGTTVAVKLVGKTGDGQLHVWSQLGQLLFDVDNEKSNNVVISIPADATSGVHWVRFHNEHGSSQLTPFVVGLIPEVVESEPNNSPANASSIDIPSVTINGVLEKSEDVDVFSVSLAAGQTVVASVLANRELGSPMDAVLQVLNSDGVVMSQVDDDHDLDPQIAFSALEDGVYFVRLFAFPSAPNSTIRLASAATYVYRLTITTEGFVDFTIPAAVDGTAESLVVLHGWNLPGNERQIVVSPQRPESFIVSDRLAHVVRIPRSPVLSLMDDRENRQLEFPCSVSGVILASKEADSFQFKGSKGQKLTFMVGAHDLYSLLDPVVRIRNEQGELLKEADDISRTNQDCEVQVTLPADGVYSVEVTDRYDSGGPRHFYVLTCTETSAEISATVAATNFTVDPIKGLDVPVTISRTNNFADAVTMSVQGLPEGVSAETVVSESKGDTAKQVTLKVRQSASAQAYSGLVSIVGQSQSGDFRATAATPNSKEKIDSIWLTVIAPPVADAQATSSTDQD